MQNGDEPLESRRKRITAAYNEADEILIMTQDFNATFVFLQSNGILRPIPYCRKCPNNTMMQICKTTSNAHDALQYKCPHCKETEHLRY